MNAMQLASRAKPKTLGELRAFLNALEKAWTEQDSQYLGRFEDQPLYLCAEGQGVAHAVYEYHGEFGLIAFPRSET